MTILLSALLFERGASGVPDTTTLPTDLRDRADSLSYTITDRFGFESAQIAFAVNLDEAIYWLQNGLMRPLVVVDPDGLTSWEGYLRSITARIGQKSVTLSLDNMANRVRCRYTTVNGVPGVAGPSSNAYSQLLYGIKDRVVSLNQDTSTAATNKAAIVLADLAFPKSNEATQAMTGQLGDIQLTLDFEGWYGTLGWVVFTRTSQTNTGISSQIGTLLSGSTPGIGAVNAFISTSTVDIMTLSNTATEKAEADTVYRDKFEALLGQGDGTNPVTWGVYEGRVFRVAAYAGATPDTITYQEYLGDARIYDAYGNVVQPWRVRPNANSQVVDLLDVGPVSTTPDAAARKYVGRVTFTASGDQVGVTLEPPGYQGIDARLAAMETFR
jgi:hypothetical protein